MRLLENYAALFKTSCIEYQFGLKIIEKNNLILESTRIVTISEIVIVIFPGNDQMSDGPKKRRECVWKCGEASFFLDFFFGSFLLYQDKRNELKT
jgi:hypothetical protein